jgi:2-oxoglutarate dehydrogenase E1 component
MANTLNKPLYQIFNEFKMDKEALDMGVQGSGDVKYHLGTSSDRSFDGRDIHMSMTANPSHLEAVNPVVEGKCRAKQEKRGQVDFKRALR